MMDDLLAHARPQLDAARDRLARLTQTQAVRLNASVASLKRASDACDHDAARAMIDGIRIYLACIRDDADRTDALADRIEAATARITDDLRAEAEYLRCPWRLTPDRGDD